MLITIAKNSFFVLFARIIDIVGVVLLIYLIARYLDLATFGQYGFILTLVTFIFSLGYAGITQITIRDVAQNRMLANQYLRASLQLRTILSLVLIGLIVGIALFIRHDTPAFFLAIIILTVSEMFSLWSISFLDILNAFELMHYDTIATLIYRLTTLGLTIMVILFQGSLWHIFLAVALATFAKVGFLGAVYLLNVAHKDESAKNKKRIEESERKDFVSHSPIHPFTHSVSFSEPAQMEKKHLWGYLAKPAIPIALAFLIMQAYMKSGILFLRGLSTAEQIALFYGPSRLLFQFQFIPFALSVALFPAFSRAAKNEPRENNLAPAFPAFAGMTSSLRKQ
ncbi:MAG: oligosaccharide flippase family protein, partial [bacterium]|nr:oligosaccharide flippase family protein [bacterium]